MRWTGPVALAAVTVVAMACAVNKRPPTTQARIIADAAPLAAEYDALRDSVVERLARRAVTRGDRTLDILILSGGGQHGVG